MNKKVSELKKLQDWKICFGNLFNFVIFPIFTTMLFFSCSPPKYPGFSETSSGIFYKIHFLGDGKGKAKQNDFAKISFKIKTISDSLISEFSDSLIQLKDLENQKFHECVSLLAEGDSATFIFRNSENEEEKKIELKVHKNFSAEKYEEEKKHIAWKNDGEMNELKRLNEYLKKNKIGNENLTDGIYFLPLKKGKGNIIEIGNTAVVHYKGCMLDSAKSFDSTYGRKEPFEFKFGDDDQVIRGLELAICQMKKGEKAKIIIPSQLAFGEGGSSTGIVPPFSTVVYEVEIINLK